MCMTSFVFDCQRQYCQDKLHRKRLTKKRTTTVILARVTLRNFWFSWLYSSRLASAKQHRPWDQAASFYSTITTDTNLTRCIGINCKSNAVCCNIPLCWVTFCTHSGIIPVGQFSRKYGKSINQSSVDPHCRPFGWLIDWLTISQLWVDWFIGFVPHDLFLRGGGRG